MPLEVPQVLDYLCDISHRVKCIGSMCYEIKSGKDPRPLHSITKVVLQADGSSKTITTKQKWPPRKPWKDLTKEEQSTGPRTI
jgi:hypothetical protein